MPGFPDLAAIIAILAAVFGAGALPKLGEAIGKLIVKRRRASGTLPPLLDARPLDAGPLDAKPVDEAADAKPVDAKLADAEPTDAKS